MAPEQIEVVRVASEGMTGSLLRDIVLGLLSLFLAVFSPIAVMIGRKAADYFEQKTKIQLSAAHREALEWAVPTAIAGTEEWAAKQLNKPSAQAKFDHAARAVQSIAPAAANAAGEALRDIIQGKVPIVRASIASSYTHSSAASLPPPERVDLSKVGALPKPPKLPGKGPA